MSEDVKTVINFKGILLANTVLSYYKYDKLIRDINYLTVKQFIKITAKEIKGKNSFSVSLFTSEKVAPLLLSSIVKGRLRKYNFKIV
jgi:hypothetical protein